MERWAAYATVLALTGAMGYLLVREFYRPAPEPEESVMLMANFYRDGRYYKAIQVPCSKVDCSQQWGEGCLEVHGWLWDVKAQKPLAAYPVTYVEVWNGEERELLTLRTNDEGKVVFIAYMFEEDIPDTQLTIGENCGSKAARCTRPSIPRS